MEIFLSKSFGFDFDFSTLNGKEKVESGRELKIFNDVDINKREYDENSRNI